MENSDDKLRKVIEEIAKRENYEVSNINIKPITSGGANYTTILYLVTVSELRKPDLNLFAKVANLNEEFRSKIESAGKAYLIEALFYTQLAANFERIYNKHNVPKEGRMNMPKYYAHILTPFEETLVLQNLEADKYVNFDRMKTFNWEYASTAVTELAKFHAISLAFREESPKEFEKIVSNFDVEIMFDGDEINMLMVQAVYTGCDAVIEEYKPKLKKYLHVDRIKDIIKLMAQKTTMLVHGDFRPSNLMHRRRNGKLEITTLDFQTLRIGDPTVDLMYFVFSGSDEEFRRLHFRRLQEHYFTQLSLALRQLNIDVDNVYPRKIFEQDLAEVLPLGLVLGLSMTSMITVDPEDVPTMDGDMQAFQIKPNQLAIERINGVVKTYVDWGVI